MYLFRLSVTESASDRTCFLLFYFPVIFAECGRCGGGGFSHPHHARSHHSAAFVFLVPETFLPPHIPRREASRGDKFVPLPLSRTRGSLGRKVPPGGEGDEWRPLTAVSFLCCSEESHLLPSVLISSGPVDHSSLQSAGETEAGLRCASGPAFRFGVYTSAGTKHRSSKKALNTTQQEFVHLQGCGICS